MADNKTKESRASVSAFLAKVPDEGQRADARVLIEMLSRLSGAPARMWGPSIIGFGRYHYRTGAGREGEMCRIGFSPRKGQTVLYVMGNFPAREKLLVRLGKYKTGKACVYFKRLSDIDMGVLEKLCAASLAFLAKTYPENG